MHSISQCLQVGATKLNMKFSEMKPLLVKIVKAFVSILVPWNLLAHIKCTLEHCSLAFSALLENVFYILPTADIHVYLYQRQIDNLTK